MVKTIQKGGKGAQLSPSETISDITNLQSSLTDNAASNFDGCTPATCADQRIDINNKQTALSLSGGGDVTNVEIDCPSVVGQNPIQQDSTCGLFKTGAELDILGSSVGGGSRKSNKKRKFNKKRKSNKRRNSYKKRKSNKRRKSIAKRKSNKKRKTYKK